MEIFNRDARIAWTTALLLFFAAYAPNGNAASRAYALLGDAGYWNANSRSVEASIRGLGVFDGILLGDNLYAGTYPEAWNPWFRDGFLFPVVAIGNHTAGYAEEIAYFKLPGEAYTVWLAPGVAAIVLNSDNVATGVAQARFLEGELRTLAAASIFVVFHHPMLTLTARHPWTERAKFHEAVRPILRKYRARISAVLNGHDHAAGAFSFDDLPVILSGAVKEAMPFTKVTNTQLGVRVKTEWAYRGVPSWAQLIVNPHSAESTVEFIEAKGTRLACRVRLKTGKWLFLEDSCYRSAKRR